MTAMPALQGELVTADRYRPGYDLAQEVRAGFLARYSNVATRTSYATAIDQWYAWCDENGLDPMRAKRAHLELFARALEAHGRKPATVAGKLHTLSGLYQFALADEHLDRNPMLHVRTFALAIPTAWAVGLVQGDRTEGALFTNGYGNRFDRRCVDRIVQRHVQACGITKRITPHSFRHTFITMARNAGVPDRDIVASTGHADSRMVHYYDRAQDDLARGATHAVAAYVGGAG